MEKARATVALLVALIVVAADAQNVFNDNFQITYGGPAHTQPSADGKSVKMTLDKVSGANFKSTKTYLYGGFSAAMKLPGGDSAGTCTAYFLTSEGVDHDELDYEFLGNVSGQPYIVQTNVFANGKGGREERIFLWFDLASGYHTYSVVWNQQQVTFMIDNVPIRIYGNYGDVDYPTKPQSVTASIFDASTWATRGGLDPVDYTQAPFVASYEHLTLDGCAATSGESLAACSSDSKSWWTQASYKSLSASQIDQLRWVRRNYLEYSYCTDTSRFSSAPPECARNNP